MQNENEPTMEDQDRSKPKFKGGIERFKGDEGVRITSETAREYQRRGARKRSENASIANVLWRKLNEPVSKGSEMTKLEALVAKTIQNLYGTDPKVGDLKVIAEICGQLVTRSENRTSIEASELPTVTLEQLREQIREERIAKAGLRTDEKDGTD